MKKIFVPVLSALLVSAEALPFLTTAAAAVLLLSPSQVEALPIDRQVGRMQARDSRQAGRQTSRARRRGFYGLPGGAVPFAYGGYRYYRVGPSYYYPYMYGGRTVYIQINVQGGYPAPPPPPGSIDIYF